MKKVVVIDDEPRLAWMLVELLESEGYEAMALTQSEGAVDVCASWLPDLVLLDILMPGMSGWDVLKALKATKSTKNIPVIVHSGSSIERQNIVELSRYDDVEMLPKPWDVDDLLDKVGMVIASKPV